MKYVYLILLLAGCGVDSSLDDSEVSSNGSDGHDSFFPQPDYHDSDTDHAVPANVTALDGVWYVPELMTWTDAVNGTPRGYHLPHRVEIVAAVDTGWFYLSRHTVSFVWSATVSRRHEDRFWRVNLADGTTNQVDKNSTMQVMYFRNRRR